jgi:hypothetical protein
VNPLAGLDIAPAVDVWRACGAHDDDVASLSGYAASAFGTPVNDVLPLPDEPCATMWAAYADEAARDGAAATLRRHLPHLRFAIDADTAQHPYYLAATRRGEAVPRDFDEWPGFDDPEGISLSITPTAAGHVAAIVARARPDFERLVQALTMRSAPTVIPASSGAVMVAGFVNWERVHQARRAWAAARGGDDTVAWCEEFVRLRAEPARWQDRFMLLSGGPYAAVPAHELGLHDDDWRARSILLRREHEAAHYVTKRLFGVMRNALHDELLADYSGIAVAAGRYRADWGRRVLGLSEAGALMDGGRLWNYRGSPAPLTDRAMGVLGRLAVRALDAFTTLDALRAADASDGAPLLARTAALVAIAQTPLAQLGSDTAEAALARAYHAARATMRAAVA